MATRLYCSSEPMVSAAWTKAARTAWSCGSFGDEGEALLPQEVAVGDLEVVLPHGEQRKAMNVGWGLMSHNGYATGVDSRAGAFEASRLP